MRYFIMFFVSAFYFWPNQVWSSLRVDLEDRTPEEVVKKARALGTQLAPCQSVGSVWVNGEELETGVAVDRCTVLTSAHRQVSDKDQTSFKFVLNKNGQAEPTNTVSDKPIVHPNFTRDVLEVPRAITHNKQTRKYEIMGVPLDTLRDISFEDYKKTPMMSRSNFFGTDLAILKLTNPLPETTGFPSFCEDNQSFSNTYGLSIGFGTLKFNWQDKGPVEVTNDPMLLNRRHVLSCKVSSQTAFDDCIFVGSYKGLLINGNESFIPKTGMMKFIPKTRMMKTR